MKNKSLLLFSLLTQLAYSQYSTTINFNSCSGRLNNSGHFFTDIPNNLPAYKVGLFTPTKSIYQMNLSTIMKDASNADRFSLTNYSQSDFSWGPIASNYSDPNYVQRFNKIWKVQKSIILDHIENFDSPGYVFDQNIMEWPGNGNTANGEAAILAPYEDINQNGTYDPENGDYPKISGDQACFLILNDERQRAVTTGSISTKTELHIMFYQFIGTPAISQSTFMNVKAYNRGGETFHDFNLGIFTDFDLGNFNDDFMGTDTDRNLNYVYNGDSFDEDSFGFVNFNSDPPALGLKSLNKPFHTNTIFTDYPSSNAGMVNAYKGLNFNGSPITNSGTPTLLMYTDTLSGGYNEVGLNHPVGDRKSFTTVEGGNFAPNDYKCFDFVIAYGNINDSFTRFRDVNALMLAADELQNLYDDSLSCSDGHLSTNNDFQLQNPVSIYPNPANDFITIESHELLLGISVYTLDGRLVLTQDEETSSSHLDVSQLSHGNYLIHVQTKSGTVTLQLSK